MGGTEGYLLGSFRLDTKAEILYRDEEPTAVGQRAVAVLRVLVERAKEPIALRFLCPFPDTQSLQSTSLSSGVLNQETTTRKRAFGKRILGANDAPLGSTLLMQQWEQARRHGLASVWSDQYVCPSG